MLLQLEVSYHHDDAHFVESSPEELDIDTSKPLPQVLQSRHPTSANTSFSAYLSLHYKLQQCALGTSHYMVHILESSAFLDVNNFALLLHPIQDLGIGNSVVPKKSPFFVMAPHFKSLVFMKMAFLERRYFHILNQCGKRITTEHHSKSQLNITTDE